MWKTTRVASGGASRSDVLEDLGEVAARRSPAGPRARARVTRAGSAPARSDPATRATPASGRRRGRGRRAARGRSPCARRPRGSAVGQRRRDVADEAAVEERRARPRRRGRRSGSRSGRAGGTDPALAPTSSSASGSRQPREDRQHRGAAGRLVGLRAAGREQLGDLRRGARGPSRGTRRRSPGRRTRSATTPSRRFGWRQRGGRSPRNARSSRSAEMPLQIAS